MAPLFICLAFPANAHRLVQTSSQPRLGGVLVTQASFVVAATTMRQIRSGSRRSAVHLSRFPAVSRASTSAPSVNTGPKIHRQAPRRSSNSVSVSRHTSIAHLVSTVAPQESIQAAVSPLSLNNHRCETTLVQSSSLFPLPSSFCKT
jgi:hypothetical protein